MNIAGLRIPVTFQVKTTTQDKYMNSITKWTDYFSCYATIGTASGYESSGVVINPEETLDFTCRWCTELDSLDSTKTRIRVYSKYYNITYINPMGYRHNSIKFNCKLDATAKA